MNSKPLRQNKGDIDADIAVLERSAPSTAAADLDEFEKFFREQFAAPAGAPPEAANAAAPDAAGPAPVVQAPPADDPLMAELARIVGQEVRVAPAQPPKMPAAVDPFAYAPGAASESAGRAQDDPLRAFEEELRRFDAEQRARNAAPAESQPIELPPDVIASHAAGEAPNAESAAYPGPVSVTPVELRGVYPETDASGYAPAPPMQDPGPLPGDELAVPPPSNFQEEAQPRSRKVMVMLGVAGVLALVGVVGTLGFGRSPKPAGQAPVIAAKPGPAKEKPADPGGVEISGQDRQVLAKRSEEPKGASSVVIKEEQPVDLNQTPKRDAARVVLPSATAPAAGAAPVAPSPPVPILMPSNAGQGNATAPAPANPTPPVVTAPQAPAAGVEPRRVRSVRISGEGEGAQPAPAPSAPSAPAAPVARVPSLASAPPPAAAAQPSAPTPAAAPKSEARPSTATRSATPAPTTTPQPARQAAAPRPAPAQQASPAENPDGGPSPLSLRPPPGASPAARVATTAPTASGGSGGFAVQLRAAPSESEARASANELRQRHASALGGSTPSVREATVNGRTVYRVRVGGLSRDAATSMCERIKAGGGSCFVAAN